MIAISYLQESVALAMKFFVGGLVISAALFIGIGFCFLLGRAASRIWLFITRQRPKS